MSDLDLKLPDTQTQPTPKGNNTLTTVLCVINLLLICVVIVVVLNQSNKQSIPAEIKINSKESGLPFMEEVVIKLKNAGAFEEAAQMIDNAIKKSKSSKTQASLLKQKGDLLVQTDKKGEALQAYYYAEKINNNQDVNLERNIKKSIIDTLRSMGKYSAVSSEIARTNRERSGQPKIKNDPVVAIIDGIELKMSDFEVHLQKFISNEITRLTYNIKKEEEIKRITEQIRKQYSAPFEKLKYLQQYVTNDILYQDALKWELEKHPKYIDTMEDMRKNLLRQLLIQENVKVDNIDDLDLKNYIETHRTELSLSTDSGTLSPDQIELVRPKAINLYTEDKKKELTQKFQQSLFQRHKVEIKREPFMDGAR